LGLISNTTAIPNIPTGTILHYGTEKESLHRFFKYCLWFQKQVQVLLKLQ